MTTSASSRHILWGHRLGLSVFFLIASPCKVPYCFLVAIKKNLTVGWMRSWINALHHRCDPDKRMEIKNKGDTGMVKKSISKSSNRPSVLVTQSLACMLVESTNRSKFCCPRGMPATHCFWSFVRSGGQKLKSSQAYTQPFADWVLKRHQVQGISGDVWTCRNLFFGKDISHLYIYIKYKLQDCPRLSVSMCIMFTNFRCHTRVDAGK